MGLDPPTVSDYKQLNFRPWRPTISSALLKPCYARVEAWCQSTTFSTLSHSQASRPCLPQVSDPLALAGSIPAAVLFPSCFAVFPKQPRPLPPPHIPNFPESACPPSRPVARGREAQPASHLHCHGRASATTSSSGFSRCRLCPPIRKLKTRPAQLLPVPSRFRASWVRGQEWSSLPGPGRRGRAV